MNFRQTKNYLPASSNHSPFFSNEGRSNFFHKGETSTSGSFFNTHGVMAKLTIGRPNDKFEKEADAMADKVALGQDGNNAFQSNPSYSNRPSLLTKCAECEEEEKLQEKHDSSDSPIAPSHVEGKLNSSRGTGSPLPLNTRMQMENSIGADFSGVRLHTDGTAAQMNMDLHSQAFTHGSDIYFNSGKYDNNSTGGKHLLAHELTHVIQQNAALEKGPEVSLKIHTSNTGGDSDSMIQRDSEGIKVPEIDEPEKAEEWSSPGGEKFQWENKVLLDTSFPKRADGLRSFLMLVKELELRGLLGPGPAVPNKEIQKSIEGHLTKLLALDDKALLEEVKKLFTQYSDTGAFPEWMQKVVVEYSGMKYKSAHGSFFSPQHLLTIIKTHQLNKADKDEKDAMMAEASVIVKDESMMDILPAKTKKKLKAEHSASSLSTLSKGIPKRERDSFNDLIKKEDSLWELYIELQKTGGDTVAFAETQEKILTSEGEIEAMKDSFGKDTWNKIVKTRALTKSILLKISSEVALQKIRKLNNLQAVALLDKMHKDGQVPEEVWKEIMGHTELRLQATSPDEIITERRALKKVDQDPQVSEEDWKNWKSFLQKWYKGDSTGWREEHRETLSANIVTTLVCDQLGSVIQNIRGVSAPGGLRKNAMAYLDAASKAGTPTTSKPGDMSKAFPAGPSSPFFKRPASIEDFPVGASIFWAIWSEATVTKEYMTIYKEEVGIKRKIKNAEEKIDTIGKKKTQTNKDAESLKAQKAVIADNNKKLEALKTQQKTMLIYTPEKDKTPDISNIVSPMGPDTQLLQKGKPITDCMNDGEWTYSVNDKRQVGKSQVESVMRAKANPFFTRTTPLKCPDDFLAGQDKTIVKQWLVWQHEATVMFVIPENSKVITFDTSFKLGKEEVKALGTRIRHLSDLINNDNIFVGFIPGKTPAPPPVQGP
jgi:hypothetical protein